MIPLERWWFGSCYWVLEVVNKEADALSKYNSQLACCCKMLAGNRLLTSFSTQFFTASAFLWSGIEQMMCLDFMICRIDMLIACNGTSSKVLNQPSFSCCSRHALSKFTTKKGASVSKSAGGSLKAKWPFSPIPTNATSIG